MVFIHILAFLAFCRRNYLQAFAATNTTGSARGQHCNRVRHILGHGSIVKLRRPIIQWLSPVIQLGPHVLPLVLASRAFFVPGERRRHNGCTTHQQHHCARSQYHLSSPRRAVELAVQVIREPQAPERGILGVGRPGRLVGVGVGIAHQRVDVLLRREEIGPQRVRARVRSAIGGGGGGGIRAGKMRHDRVTRVGGRRRRGSTCGGRSGCRGCPRDVDIEVGLVQ